jgi:WD40 repeat protein
MNAAETDSPAKALPAFIRWLTNVRFSLLTLLLGVLLCGSGMSLYRRWSPWVLEETIEHPNIKSAEFSPDGRRIITAGYYEILISDVESGKQTAKLKGDTDSFVLAVFAPDGQRVASIGYMDTEAVRLWDATSGSELARLGPKRKVHSLAFSPDGKHIVTADHDGMARVYDVSNGKEIGKIDGHGGRAVRYAVFSPDGGRILTVGDDTTARIWDTARLQQILELSGHRHFVRSAEFSPDGQRVVTVSYDKTARIWNTATGRETASLKIDDFIYATAKFSPNGRHILTTDDSGSADMWDAARGTLATTQFGRFDHTYSASFSPDGERIITASGFDGVRVWDAQGRPLVQLPDIGYVESASFSANRMRIVTKEVHTAHVWLRRRPEYAWGVFVLPEFWLNIVFLGGFGWSLWRGWRAAKISTVSSTEGEGKQRLLCGCHSSLDG